LNFLQRWYRVQLVFSATFWNNLNIEYQTFWLSYEWIKVKHQKKHHTFRFFWSHCKSICLSSYSYQIKQKLLTLKSWVMRRKRGTWMVSSGFFKAVIFLDLIHPYEFWPVAFIYAQKGGCWLINKMNYYERYWTSQLRNITTTITVDVPKITAWIYLG
jgi:hypothetical protein